MHKEITIVPYTVSLGLVEPLFEIFSSYPTMFYTEDLEVIKKRINEDTEPNYPKFVARQGQIPVGFVSATKPWDTTNTWFLSWYAVSPSFQNQGIGAQLLQHIEHVLAKTDAPRMYIDTVDSPDTITQKTNAFYRKHGYREVGKIPQYFSEDESKVIYFKEL